MSHPRQRCPNLQARPFMPMASGTAAHADQRSLWVGVAGEASVYPQKDAKDAKKAQNGWEQSGILFT